MQAKYEISISKVSKGMAKVMFFRNVTVRQKDQNLYEPNTISEA